jgi:flagellar hook-associated protein 1 FlgK
MSVLNALQTGYTGLRAASARLETTTHNVSNASTEGFTRKRVDSSTADPLRRGLVFLGQGVRLDGVSRAADPLALGRLLRANGEAGADEARRSALSTFETLFEPSAGASLRQSVDALFAAMQSATADPSDLGLRRSVTTAAQSFATTVNGVARGLADGITERDEVVAATVAQANADLAEVAALDEQIARGGGAAFAAGDLMDRRDAALGRLADALGATAHFEPDGTSTVLVGGHAVVSRGFARTLEVDLTGAAPRLLVSVDEARVDVTRDVHGVVGGELAARADLTSWRDELDATVSALAGALNAQQGAGFTRGGAPGGPVFQLPASGSVAEGLRVDAVLAGDPGAWAFAGAATALAGDGANLAALLAVRDQALVGGRSAGAAMSGLVNRVSSEVSLATSRADGASARLQDARELYANLTSVDLDEEAVSLVQHQTAYAAAAKVVTAADEMLQTLLSLG